MNTDTTGKRELPVNFIVLHEYASRNNLDYNELCSVIRKALSEAAPAESTEDGRSCTCHPDDNPPIPCAKKYAIQECRATAPAAPLAGAQLVRAEQFLDGADVQDEAGLLNYYSRDAVLACIEAAIASRAAPTVPPKGEPVGWQWKTNTGGWFQLDERCYPRASYPEMWKNTRPIYAAAPQGAVQECQWRPDEDGNWWTGCGEGHIFTDGGPKENGYKFCCYCGNGLVIAAQGGDKP